MCIKFIIWSSMQGVLFLLIACSPATRYVLVTDRGDVNFADGDRFYICLTTNDAKRVSGLLRLRTASDVGKYEQTRTANTDPLEPILFDLVKSNYQLAKTELDKQADAVPLYLRSLLKADLSYEISNHTMSATELAQMYQMAYENQICDLNKDLIKTRIRQVRYGR